MFCWPRADWSSSCRGTHSPVSRSPCFLLLQVQCHGFRHKQTCLYILQIQRHSATIFQIIVVNRVHTTQYVKPVSWLAAFCSATHAKWRRPKLVIYNALNYTFFKHLLWRYLFTSAVTLSVYIFWRQYFLNSNIRKRKLSSVIRKVEAHRKAVPISDPAWRISQWKISTILSA